MKNLISTAALNNKDYWSYLAFFLIVAVVLMLPNLTFAAGEDAVDEFMLPLCRAIDLLTGPFGKAIATIAIVFLGIMVFMGKVTWGVAVATGVAIGAIFGASNIVTYLSTSGAGGDYECPTS